MAEPFDPQKTQPIEKTEAAFFSRYRLTAELGRGGMGIVWRAEDTKLRREVALKFLPDFVVSDREAMSDLAAETRRCLDLTHPHIVRVYDLVEDGLKAAISMELVDGPSLAERKLSQPDRCFSPDAIASWVAQLCAALDYAHEKCRIVHRDLKPLNLLVNTQGDLKVVDFGISRSLSRSSTRMSSDIRSTAVSLAYVGPQQLIGEPAAVGDDIYSLGATLYELLTGKPPFFEGDIITQLREIVPPTLTARRAELKVTEREPIPLEWEETVAACLAKKATDRPQSAGEVAARLRVALPGTLRPFEVPPPTPLAATTANPTSSETKAPQKNRRRGWLVAGAIAGLALVSTLLWTQRPAPHESPRSAASAPDPGVIPEAPPSPLATSPVAAIPGPEFIVTISPPDADARVWLGRQTNVAVPPEGSLALKDLPDGEQTLTVQASGYQPYTTKVTVKDGRGGADVKLAAVPGAVLVVARPGTVVTARDPRDRVRPVGTVPASGILRSTNDLTVGTYAFKLAHPDCADAEQRDVVLAVGRTPRVAPPQTALPGELLIFSEPTGAAVTVNGTPAGTTPATLADQPSEKALAIEVFLSGYRRFRQSVTLKPKESATVNVGTLVAESGAIEFRLGAAEFRLPQARITIDGHTATLVKGAANGLEVGPRTVEIVHPNYEPWKQAVTVQDRQTVRVEVKLAPKPATLTLAVTGPTAPPTLSVNGKPVVVKGGRATVPAEEELALEVSAKGFKTARQSLKLPAKGVQTLTVALEKIPVAEVGRPWTVPEVGIVLMPIAAGSFAMGSDVGDPTERPVTQVTISKPFWLGKTEVSQREWTAVMASNPSQNKGDNLPVENVSWLEAEEFCRKLNVRERAADRLPAGYAYALPTDAQWEYACRAGATGLQAENIAEIAWHEGNSQGTTRAVGTKPANAWGLHDMLGNVWEWCADGWAEKLKGGAVTDPKVLPNGALRVRRGSAFGTKLNVGFFRFASRGRAEPDYRVNNLGFRLALAPGQ